MNKQGAESTEKAATTHVLLDVTQTQVRFYENLLERDLLRGGTLPDMNAPVVLEVEVEPGAPFEGCEVRELGLPPSRFWLPTALLPSEAKNGMAAWRQGE